MIEIRYGEHYEVADLAGKSVAEAREQYKDDFGIPDKARAKLNDKEIQPKLETETLLNEDDKLLFAEKSKKQRYLVAALLTALVITSSLFAFAYTTATITLTGVSVTDFAKVEAQSGPAGGYLVSDARIFGRYKGTIASGDLFKITKAADYPGDLVVNVHLTNAFELVTAYHSLKMKMELWDTTGGTGDNLGDWENSYSDQTLYELLSLEKQTVSFVLTTGSGTGPWYVYLASGSYHTTPWGGWAPISDAYLEPDIYCEVAQR